MAIGEPSPAIVSTFRERESVQRRKYDENQGRDATGSRELRHTENRDSPMQPGAG